MQWSNHYRYRAELLLGFLDQNPKSEGFNVIADALGIELESAYNALVVEIADAYQIPDKSYGGLANLQQDMLEVRLLTQLEQDSQSWLNQIRYLNRHRPGPSADVMPVTPQLIGTDRIDTESRATLVNREEIDALWYQRALQQWDEMAETIRQASINE